ncbi:MAG: hypothetical protein AAF755_12790 [Pseudomonadota bacterium]
MTIWKNQAFTIAHADDGKFKGAGLRLFFDYEGQGEHTLRAGSCVLQPPGIKHREVRHSDDMELIEIISPADFTMQEEAAP